MIRWIAFNVQRLGVHPASAFLGAWIIVRSFQVAMTIVAVAAIAALVT